MRSLHKSCLMTQFFIDVCGDGGSLPQREGGSKSRFGNETSPPGFAIGHCGVVLVFAASFLLNKLNVGFLNQYITIFTSNAQINTSRSSDEDTCELGTMDHYKMLLEIFNFFFLPVTQYKHSFPLNTS